MDSVIYLEGRGKPLQKFSTEEFREHIDDIRGKLISQGVVPLEDANFGDSFADQDDNRPDLRGEDETAT